MVGSLCLACMVFSPSYRIAGYGWSRNSFSSFTSGLHWTIFGAPSQLTAAIYSRSTIQRRVWRRRVIRSTLNTSANPSGGSGPETPDPSDKSSFGLGSTRLGRLISARQKDLLQRWNAARRNFSAKIFLLLFGFFSANALATILGQTGDWDILAAGILVAIIEGVGYLMYCMPVTLGRRGKAVVEFINYWKLGFVLALFVDAFKVGS